MNDVAHCRETRELTDADRWRAVCDNDADIDDRFVYAVSTTGIYCRPGCRSRRPRRENVVFFDNARAAQAAGFRACKRCRPSAFDVDTDHARVEKACRLIESSDTPPTLAALARQVHVSAYHFHRIFKRITGLTPHQYAVAVRDRRLRGALRTGADVTQAMMDAGFSSSGHFHAAAGAALGMPPSRYGRGGADTEIRFALGECDLGSILVGGTERGICAIDLGDCPQVLLRAFQARFDRARLIGDDAVFQRYVAQIVAFVEQPTDNLALPLDIRGTAFQQRVWNVMRRIPPGRTQSYAQIAAAIGAPKATRAVANACAANRLAIAIPCHRVIRADGEPGGYRWHVSRKQALLAREARHAGGDHPDFGRRSSD